MIITWQYRSHLVLTVTYSLCMYTAAETHNGENRIEKNVEYDMETAIKQGFMGTRLSRNWGPVVGSPYSKDADLLGWGIGFRV